MKKYYYYLLNLLFVGISFTNYAQHRIQFQGEEIFINGANIPWNNFGWDFGEHPKWGRGYDSTHFENVFEELEAHGVNCVRMWVHCDGRATPNFDKNGAAQKLDQGMIDEMEDFLLRARRHNILVIFTLWSHNLLEDNIENAGKFAGLHQSLIGNEKKMKSYLENVLTPMVKSLNHHCNLLAWEIISEPEWCMRILGGAKTDQKVPVKAMQRFVGRCIQVIRENSSQLVTVGSAYACGNDKDRSTRNFWHKDEFERAGFDPKVVHLDFYSFHYFEWMGDKKSIFKYDFDHWELDKPILLAESAVRTAKKPKLMKAKKQLNYVKKHNYAGTLFWSMAAGDEYSQWDTFKGDLADFSQKHQLGLDIQCNDFYDNHAGISFNFYPNPVQKELKIKYDVETPENITIRLYDINEKLLWTLMKELNPQKTDDVVALMDQAPAGVFILEVWQEKNGKQAKVFMEKIIKD